MESITKMLAFLMVFGMFQMDGNCQVGSQMKGITFVAPPKPIGDEEINALEWVNTNWIALVPYGFGRKGEPSIRYNLERQWWGERTEGIIACTKLAHDNRHFEWFHLKYLNVAVDLIDPIASYKE